MKMKQTIEGGKRVKVRKVSEKKYGKKESSRKGNKQTSHCKERKKKKYLK